MSDSYDINSAANITYTGGNFPYCLDFDGDGDKDLYLWSGTTYSYLLKGPLSAGTIDITDSNNYDVRFTNLSSSNSVGAGGDINGDGKEDILSCGTLVDDCRGWFGVGTGGSTVDFTLEPSDSDLEWMAMHISIADVTGDGKGDIISGDDGYDGVSDTVLNSGRIMIWKGGALTGADTAWDYEIRGPSVGSALGTTIAGDVDGDGYDDLFIKHTQTGSAPVYIVWGRSATDWASATPIQISTSDLRITSINAGTGYAMYWGENWGHVRDINGDGKDDIIIGDAESTGRTCVILGRTRSEWTSMGPSINMTTQADVCINGADANDYSGSAVSFGDFNGDGKQEFVVNAPFGDGPSDSNADAGEVAIVFFNFPSNYEKPLTINLSDHF